MAATEQEGAEPRTTLGWVLSPELAERLGKIAHRAGQGEVSAEVYFNERYWNFLVDAMCFIAGPEKVQEALEKYLTEAIENQIESDAQEIIGGSLHKFRNFERYGMKVD
jgi:hypothetical protein